MTNDSLSPEYLHYLAEAISEVRRLTAAGSSQSEMVAASRAMRYLLDHFHDGWRSLDFDRKSAIIYGSKIDRKCAYHDVHIFTAEDTPPPPEHLLNNTGFIGLVGFGYTSAETGEFIQQPLSYGNIINIRSSQPLDHGVPLGENHGILQGIAMPFHEYFDSAIIRSSDRNISRATIVRYIANTMGSHVDPEHNGARKMRESFEHLDILTVTEVIAGRSLPFLAFMSICQEFVGAEDVSKFEKHVKSTVDKPMHR